MADDEDDYLSDKFLLAAAAVSAPKTYAERRKEAQKEARLKNEQNRTKNRRQRELEARDAGLNKSLFERAKEEQEAGLGINNKAMGIMAKMGFKPGQSLGLGGSEDNSSGHLSTPKEKSRETSEPLAAESSSRGTSRHIVEPIPLNEWTGKKGIGLLKRAPSPSFQERVAKMAKMAEDASHESFRDRTRREYEERRADGRLVPAQSTCLTLDERSGISFNILTLNPNNPESYPEGLIDALADNTRIQVTVAAPPPSSAPVDDAYASRLRDQMKADSLREMPSLLDDDDTGAEGRGNDIACAEAKERFSHETLEEAAHFLRLGARDRLRVVLAYLRDKYSYCFWCGTQYNDPTDMEEHCPGPEEEDHD